MTIYGQREKKWCRWQETVSLGAIFYIYFPSSYGGTVLLCVMNLIFIMYSDQNCRIKYQLQSLHRIPLTLRHRTASSLLCVLNIFMTNSLTSSKVYIFTGWFTALLVNHLLFVQKITMHNTKISCGALMKSVKSTCVQQCMETPLGIYTILKVKFYFTLQLYCPQLFVKLKYVDEITMIKSILWNRTFSLVWLLRYREVSLCLKVGWLWKEPLCLKERQWV